MRYSLGVRTSNVTSGVTAVELFTGAGETAKILEFSITMAAATASIFGIGRPAAQGITPTTPVALLPEDPNNQVITVKTALAWATPPTIPAAFLKRFSLPAVIGANLTFRFPPKSLILLPSTSLVLWNLGTNGVSDVTITIDIGS